VDFKPQLKWKWRLNLSFNVGYFGGMKHPLTFSFVTVTAVALVFYSCSQPAVDATATFEANSATIAQVFADFEAESDQFFTHFAPDAVWRGTGLNAPDTVTLEQVTAKYKAAWAKYNYELISPVNFLPGVNPETKAMDGSVRGYFEWNISKAATDSTEAKSVRVKVYESFDFNPEGQVIYTQVYGNLLAGYAYLEEN